MSYFWYVPIQRLFSLRICIPTMESLLLMLMLMLMLMMVLMLILMLMPTASFIDEVSITSITLDLLTVDDHLIGRQQRRLTGRPVVSLSIGPRNSARSGDRPGDTAGFSNRAVRVAFQPLAATRQNILRVDGG